MYSMKGANIFNFALFNRKVWHGAVVRESKS